MANFVLAGTSVTGAGHRRDGTPCQDACFYEQRDEGTFALVACDGAGSRSRSAEGAAAVAPTVGRLLLSNAEDVVSRRLRGDAIVDVARSAIEAIVGSSITPCRPDDFACTMVALLVHGNTAMSCHIGDGAIVCLEAEIARCISPPQRAAGGGSGTQFVTSPGALPRMWKYDVPEYLTGFLCCTDGAQPGLLNTVTSACSPLVVDAITRLDFACDNGERLRELDTVIRYDLQSLTEDDITLVVARRANVKARFGCPRCKQHSVVHKISPNRLAECGWCKRCHQQVYWRRLTA